MVARHIQMGWNFEDKLLEQFDVGWYCWCYELLISCMTHDAIYSNACVVRRLMMMWHNSNMILNDVMAWQSTLYVILTIWIGFGILSAVADVASSVI